MTVKFQCSCGEMIDAPPTPKLRDGIVCSHCGAPADEPPEDGYIRCGYCDSVTVHGAPYGRGLVEKLLHAECEASLLASVGPLMYLC